MPDNDTEAAAAEVTEWFFEDYLPNWVGVGNGSIDKGPGFILDYWGVPLYDCRPDGGQWALDGDSVTGLLNTTHTRLKANGYAYTEVVDRAVRAYHRNGAAIEVIWSRRRADDTEIERLAVHFEVIRTRNGWRIAGIQRRPTHADALSDVWGGTGNVRTTQVAHARRWPHVEQPAALAGILRRFRTRLAPRTSAASTEDHPHTERLGK